MAVGRVGLVSDPTERSDAGGHADLLRLGRIGRAWRALLLAVLAAGFVTGSVVGQDPWWPFSPWRMFSTSTPPSGAVVAMAVEVRTAADPQWRPAELTPSSVGLNRAEVEGRVPQIQSQPERLGTLAGSHARLRPDSAPWTAVRLVRREAILVDRRPTGEVRSTVLATWEAAGQASGQAAGQASGPAS
jgi:hypothetical protein